MSEYLSPGEMHTLTGMARALAQSEWLAAHSIPFLLDGKRLIVSRYHINLAEMKRDRLAALKESITPYILRPDADVYPCGTYPPQGECAGIYMLFNKDGRVNYIGQSLGIGHRNIQHYWAVGRGQRLPFVEYAAVKVPDLLRNYMEVAHIYALQPPENCLPNGPRWNRHDEAVKLITEVWSKNCELPIDEQNDGADE